MKRKLIILLLSLFNTWILNAQSVTITKDNDDVFISNSIGYLIDTSQAPASLDLKDPSLFKPYKTAPVFRGDINNIWFKFSVTNHINSNVYLKISYSNISKVSLYLLDSNTVQLLEEAGNSMPIASFKPGNPNIVFNLDVPENDTRTYLVHVKSIHPIILPLHISSTAGLISDASVEDISMGFYFGLLAVIFFYNLFLFVSTKDINYLLYIFYIFCITNAQLAASGYGYYYLWPTKPEWNKLAVLWTSYFSGISAFLFSISFLQIRYYVKKVLPFLFFIFALYMFGLIMSLLNNYSLSYLILNYSTLLNGIMVLGVSIYLVKTGYRPAIFYLVAWSAFLISVVILVLSNINILPYNDFTSSALYFGSSLEVVLLSIALADRINVLKKEKDLSQAEALAQARKNERLVNEQNIILEEEVSKRTGELQHANRDLNEALTNLQDAQTQLVEAEKMASLGQLTAGIAHEINNPINFVKSNINPLRLDIKDVLEVLTAYDEIHSIKDEDDLRRALSEIQSLKEDIDVDYTKKEIDSLIAGIEEGAERTAEIVRGLRTFSRVDEAALKVVNIHDGILSTIVLLKNSMPYYVKLVKNFNADGVIECFPGKLNQVFMNIITNAIHAIKAKPVKEDETLIITTNDTDDGQVEISIKDSGIGMSEDVKYRIFEPFFTTKDVGEGTGLGMAIVFKIIKKHAGKINIVSAPGEGAEFIITLPHKYRGEE